MGEGVHYWACLFKEGKQSLMMKKGVAGYM